MIRKTPRVFDEIARCADLVVLRNLQGNNWNNLKNRQK